MIGYPNKPTSLRVSNTRKGIGISWKQVSGCHFDLQFHIEYRQQSSDLWIGLSANDSKTDIQRIEITDLKADTAYRIRMYAANVIGKSSYTAEYNITTNDLKGSLYNFRLKFVK